METSQVYRTADVFKEGLEVTGSDSDTVVSADEEVIDFVQDDEFMDMEFPHAGADPEDQDAVSDLETENETENFVQDDELEEIREEDVQVSSPAFTEDNPMPVYLVEQEEEDELALYTVSGSPYPGAISTTYLDYFAGIADKLSYNEHYMAFRSGQYEYYMVWGEGLEYDGYEFKGSALSYCRIYTGTSSSAMKISYGFDTFYLIPGTGFVYSDLDYFASLTKGGTGIEILALLFAVGFAVVYSVCHDLFDYVMQHIYRKSR